MNKYIVAQLGARRHYAIPRMLHDAGMLAHFYTDICAVRDWPVALRLVPEALRSPGMKRLLGRVPHGVPVSKITAFTGFGWEYQRRRVRAKTPGEKAEIHIWAGSRFCELVLREGMNGADGVYTFNSAGLELLQAAKKRGLRTVMEQTIAPRSLELNLMQEEQERFPDWEPAQHKDGALNAFIEREEAEWSEADLILCGSEFVRDGIASSGGPVDRCAVVPYGVDARFSIPERPPHEGPLRVLTVGAVGLRKGIPYVLEAARQLRGKATFRMVGPIGVQPEAEARLRSAVELTGPIPRSEIVEQYKWADVFLLPSLCEGSATVVYEAMSAGLPVICTPNTGSVVRDGIDGYIVPIRNAEAIAAAVECLTDKELRVEMSLNAIQRSSSYDINAYKASIVAKLKAVQ